MMRGPMRAACARRGKAFVVGQIVEIEPGRIDGRVDLCPAAPFENRRLRAEDRASDRAGERIDEPVLAPAADVPAKVDVLCSEQPRLDDVVELFEVGAAGPHVHVHVAQIQGAGHRALGVEVQDGGREAGPKRPGGIAVLSGRCAAAADGDAGRGAIEISGSVDTQAAARIGLDGAREGKSALSVVKREPAVPDRQIFEGHPIALVGLFPLYATAPIAVALLVAHKRRLEPRDIERADIGIARKQRKDRDAHGGARHFQHVSLAGPGRLADPQIADQDRRGEGKSLAPRKRPERNRRIELRCQLALGQAARQTDRENGQQKR